MNKKTLEQVSQSNLKEENILERYDLQAMMVNSWDTVRNELDLPTTFLVGQEITPHESVKNSIDMLAYNPDESNLIVIELKRDKNKLQLLQAISYAAMVNTWDDKILMSKVSQQESNEELIDILKETPVSNDVKIILIAERFDPEVMITADWLVANYGLDIVVYEVRVHSSNGEVFLSFDQRYPLKELQDTYEARTTKKRKEKNESEITWEEVLPNLKYDFAKEALGICLKVSQGQPSRRRFGSLKSNFKGFNWISINFRSNYLNIYCKVPKEHGFKSIKNLLGEGFEINTWRDGISFKITDKKDWDKLCSWLELH